MSRRSSALRPSLLVVMLTACGGNDSSAPPPPESSTTSSVAAVAVEPRLVSLVVGEALTLNAILTDRDGHVLIGRASHWSTTNALVVTVNQAGVASAVAAGSAYIVAASGAKRDSALVSVTLIPAPVATVTISPNPVVLAVGESVAISATVKDATGAVLPGRSVAWSVADSSRASVSGVGMLTGNSTGTTRVYAASEGKRDSAVVSIAAATTTTAFISTVGSINRAGIGGMTLPDSLQVMVLDSMGRAIPGLIVTWESPFSPVTASVTNVSGVASTAGPFVPADHAINTFPVRATLRGGGYVLFTLRRLDPYLLRVMADSGNAQVARVGETLAAPVTVRVFEMAAGSNRYYPGVAVEWIVTSGGGLVSSRFSHTDLNGYARINWMMGATAGNATLEARVVGLQQPADFSATVLSAALSASSRH